MSKGCNLRSFGCSFRYSDKSAFADVHEHLKNNSNVLSIRDALKDALTAFHYADALETLGAIAISRSVLHRKLYDLDALENRLKSELAETLKQPSVSPVTPAATDLTPVSVSVAEGFTNQDNFDNF